MAHQQRRGTPGWGWLLLSSLFLAALAWMTYGSLQDVAGSLVFFLVGLLALFPWIVPLIGLPLGILDRLVFNFLHPYETALALARVQPSWLTRAWYWAVTAVGMMAGLLLTYLLVRRWVQKAQRGRRKQPDYALVHCAIFDGYRDHPLISDGVILIRNRVDPGGGGLGNGGYS